ncbi:MAG: lipoyl protein ligase domain-containing protein [Planctomycetota bacterium]|jgi:lipoate-protein ligase B
MPPPVSVSSASASPFRSSEALEVYLLGLVDFDAVQALQRMVLDDLSQRDDRQGVLIVCEHPPVVSIGRDGSIAGLLADQDDLIAQQIDVRYVARRGGVLLHGPGQVAGYLMLPVERLGVTQQSLERRVQAVLQKIAGERRVPAWPSNTGCALECRCGQFAWIGSGVDAGVSSHGFSLNVNPDVVAQRLIQAVPDDTSIASLSMQRMRVVAMPKVREALVRHLSAEFGYEDFHVYTRHPLLKRTVRKRAARLEAEEASSV